MNSTTRAISGVLSVLAITFLTSCSTGSPTATPNPQPASSSAAPLSSPSLPAVAVVDAHAHAACLALYRAKADVDINAMDTDDPNLRTATTEGAASSYFSIKYDAQQLAKHLDARDPFTIRIAAQQMVKDCASQVDPK